MSHADARRAAALITHRASSDLCGVQAIFDEVNEANTARQLLVGVLDGYTQLAAELRTPEERTAIEEFLAKCAGPAEESSTRRAAAQVIAAFGQRDHVVFEALLANANESPNGPALLVGAVADTWTSLLPELCTEYGVKRLREWTTRIAEHESKDD